MPTHLPGQFHRRAGRPILEQSFVVYLDVLGTRTSAVGRRAVRTLEQLDNAVAQAKSRADMDDDSSWTVSSWFSDNLAIAASIGCDENFQGGIFGSIIIATIWVQFMLAIEGFFTRGGFAAGKHFMDEDINFGPALVAAVDLEKRAIVPRILVGRRVRPWIEKFCAYYSRQSNMNPYRFHLAVDRGDVFVNYLEVVYESDDPHEQLEMLERHRAAIAANLLETEDRDHDHVKAEWAAGYHNWFCDQFGTTRSIKLPGTYPLAFARYEPTTWL